MHLYLLNKRGENTNERKRIKRNDCRNFNRNVADNQAVSTATVTAEEKPVTTHVTETTEIEEGLIPDITEVDLRKQLLLKNAVDPEALLKMKAFSPARLGVGRAGTRYMTSSTLRFRADHAAHKMRSFQT